MGNRTVYGIGRKAHGLGVREKVVDKKESEAFRHGKKKPLSIRPQGLLDFG